MLICLACYGDRLATLMESATELRFYGVEQNVPVPSGTTPAPGTGVVAMIDLLAGLGIDVLICGGLSGCTLAALQQSGVPVVPWIGGTAEEVATAWAAGGAEAVNRLRLPGCALRGCGRGRAGHGHRCSPTRAALRTPMQTAKVEKSS
ncbi:MAG: dinitrogenase iron-molybdenum cofactor biosynthesis protein [Deltaproteobacteria bacterium HGW-Deltaproteobacteria-8]|jgi:predicted Fe-Mo cluster-binding NifX family protein|nr:MAG: dinitrogenase iron-molybdenum cofactor biosynthesis protein [Deltaproteobacteria bacterium HGW-Deltaproteobacteria-8]